MTVSLVVEKSKKFNDTALHFETSLKRYWKGSIDNPLDPDYRNRTINNCLSYFYSLHEVNKLKKLHEYEHDFKYDWVIRCRTDSIVHTKMQFKACNPEVINYTGIMNQPDGMINDWFNFGGSDVMDAFMVSSQYLNLSLISVCVKTQMPGAMNLCIVRWLIVLALIFKHITFKLRYQDSDENYFL